MDDSFWAPRAYFAEPIPEIYKSAQLLSAAADAHCRGEVARTRELILEADIPAVGMWLDAIWARCDQSIIRKRKVEGAPPVLPKESRPKPRLPTKTIARALIDRDGHICRFCGLPVIDPDARKFLFTTYKDCIRWLSQRGEDQHTAFQALWLQFDHVLPNSRGGETTLENMIVTCAACNFGRMDRTLEEVGISDPRGREIVRSDWDGLTRVLP